jgi:hypothetical protein
MHRIAPKTQNYPPKMTVVLRLRIPVLEPGLILYSQEIVLIDLKKKKDN